MEKLKFKGSTLPTYWDLTVEKTMNELLNERFRSFLNNEEFEIRTGYEKDRFEMQAILKSKDKSFFYPVEIVCVNLPSNNSFEVVCQKMFEYLNFYWEDYFKNARDVYFTIDWSKHEHSDLVFYIRGAVRNLVSETLADEFLKEHGFGDYAIEPISMET